MSTETLGGLREYMQRTINEIGEDFEDPRQDWEPVFIVHTPNNIEIIPVAAEWMATGTGKDLLGEILREYVTQGALRYALLVNGHGVDPRDISQEDAERLAKGEVRVEQFDAAYEFLALTVGDAEEEQCWLAEIKRKPETLVRTLGQWQKIDHSEGRFAGLNEYMRR